MIATLIPYFLIANISNNATWPNGPEFKFGSKVEINLKGLSEANVKNGFDIFNEFTCRPKTETSLHCKFQHKNMTARQVNEQTGKIDFEDMNHADSSIYTPVYFEIEFDKKGVSKIILEEEMVQREVVVSIFKALANALNVGTDLSGVRLSDDPEILKDTKNIILNQCKGEIVAAFHTSDEVDMSGGKWQLDMAPPLAKLEGKNLMLLKNWNNTDCIKAKELFWLGMFVTGIGELDSDEEFTTNLLNVDDIITVSPGLFISGSGRRMEVTGKGKHIELSELGNLHLVAIQPAEENWPAIQNPTTVDLNVQK